MYEKTTHGIRITVRPFFMAEQSYPEGQHFVWAYQVRIENRRDQAVKLLGRHWKITDANGGVQEVKGAGVVGEQPELEPGDSYEYTSGTPLVTPSGIMMGRYEMRAADGERFWVDVPAFSLDSPHEKTILN